MGLWRGGATSGRRVGSVIPSFLEGVKPKRGKYKRNSLIWMADGIVECRDTTTNQKRAGAEEERMEKRDKCGRVAAEGCQCTTSAGGGREVAT